MTLKLTKAQTKTRLLLALWVLNGTDVEMNKSDLTRRVKRKGEVKDDYAPLYKALAKEGSIVVTMVRKKPLWEQVKLTEAGLQSLMAGLQDKSFVFDANVGARVANALLNMVRQNAVAPVMNGNGKNGNGKKEAIASYDEFKPVVLETYERLNRDFNLDNLVPIYRIRREIGNRVERSKFNEWLLDLQANDVFQLLEGNVEDSAPDKIEDSITTKVNGLRCYAKLLIA